MAQKLRDQGKKTGGKRRGKAKSKAPAATPKLDETQRASVEARRRLLQSEIREIEHLESQAAVLAERKKDKTRAISDHYRIIKSELGMSRKSVEAMRSLAAMPHDEMMATIDHQRETFEALLPGEQGDFFGAFEPTKPGTAALDVAFTYGAAAGEAGWMPTTNHFNSKTEPELYDRWAEGWKKGQARAAERAKKKGATLTVVPDEARAQA